MGAGRVLPVDAGGQYRGRRAGRLARRVPPQRLLVIDEFGTFAGMAARMHKRARGTGPSPALDQRRRIEWQGRQAGHRLVLAVHQPNLRLFGDSDSRGQVIPSHTTRLTADPAPS